MAHAQHASKTRLLDAALHVIRAKGYTAATIDDICHEAGVTKGSFFHHFKGKEDLALAATEHFTAMANGLFASAPYREASDPRERVLGYVDFRAALLDGTLPDVTCLLGTMVQETYETHPVLRAACDKGIGEHARTVAADIAEAKRRHAPTAKWSPESVGLFTQAVMQGAFILAKARHDPEVAVACLGHLRQYLEMLLTQHQPKVSEKPYGK